MTETYHHHEGIRRTALAARRQLAALTPQNAQALGDPAGFQIPHREPARKTDRRHSPPTGKRTIWRAFATESAEAKVEPRDCPVVRPREFYQSTAGLPELHGLIDQIRPWYARDTIDDLLKTVAAAEMRLADALVAILEHCADIEDRSAAA
jgi:hypothetical protein